jgi:hypothetical protein
MATKGVARSGLIEEWARPKVARKKGVVRAATPQVVAPPADVPEHIPAEHEREEQEQEAAEPVVNEREQEEPEEEAAPPETDNEKKQLIKRLYTDLSFPAAYSGTYAYHQSSEQSANNWSRRSS